MRPLRWQGWLLPVLLLLNAGLKFSWLGVNELAGDEPFTLFQAQRALPALFHMLRTENNPPLHFLLMHAWTRVVGLDPAAMRASSALFSVLTVWPLFLLGRRLGGTMTGLTAALLFTFSQHQYAFAHELRAYPLLVLLTTTSMQLLGSLGAQPQGRRWRVAALAAVNVLVVYTHFFGWIMVGLEGLILAVVRSWRPALRAWLWATVAAVISYVPYAVIFLQRATSSIAQGTWVKPHGAEEVWNMVRRWSNQPVVTVLLLGVIVVALVRRRWQAFAVSALWMLVPLLGLWLVQPLVPAYVDRYLLFASPGLYLLAGQALAVAIGAPRWKWLAPVGGVVAMAVTFVPWKQNELHPSRVVERTQRWGSIVLVDPADYELTYAWHLDSTLYRHPEELEEALRARNVYGVHAPGDLPEKWRSASAVVLVDAWSALHDPAELTKQEIRTDLVLMDSTAADRGVWVYRFGTLSL